MAYLDSNKISVFPSAYRGKNNNNKQLDPSSFLMTEGNLTKDSIFLRDFYYIKDDDMYIVISGYIFKAKAYDVVSLILSDIYPVLAQGGDVYARIKLYDYESAETPKLKTTTLIPYTTNTIAILDNDEGKFLGLDFTSSIESGELHYIHLGTKQAGDILIVWDETNTKILSSNQILDKDGENSISEHFSTNNLDTDTLIINNIAPSSGTCGLKIDDSGNITSSDNSSEHTVTSSSGNNVYVFNYIKQDTNGRISEVTSTTLPAASSSNGGIVTTGNQTFSGKKTFSGGIVGQVNLVESNVNSYSFKSNKTYLIDIIGPLTILNYIEINNKKYYGTFYFKHNTQTFIENSSSLEQDFIGTHHTYTVLAEYDEIIPSGQLLKGYWGAPQDWELTVHSGTMNIYELK